MHSGFPRPGPPALQVHLLPPPLSIPFQSHCLSCCTLSTSNLGLPQDLCTWWSLFNKDSWDFFFLFIWFSPKCYLCLFSHFKCHCPTPAIFCTLLLLTFLHHTYHHLTYYLCIYNLWCALIFAPLASMASHSPSPLPLLLERVLLGLRLRSRCGDLDSSEQSQYLYHLTPLTMDLFHKSFLAMLRAIISSSGPSSGPFLTIELNMQWLRWEPICAPPLLLGFSGSWAWNEP